MLGFTRDFNVNDKEASAYAICNGTPAFAASVARSFASAKGPILGVSGAPAENTVIVVTAQGWKSTWRRVGGLAVGVLIGLADTARFDSFPENEPAQIILTDDPMPCTRWFTGKRPTYAEHVLRHETLGDPQRTMLHHSSELRDAA